MSLAGTYEKEREFSTQQVLMANQAIGECMQKSENRYRMKVLSLVLVTTAMALLLRTRV